MLTTREATAIISAAETMANTINVPVIIAVLDAGAHLKAFLRMDGAVLGSIDIATKKARTAVLFEINSELVWEYCKPGAPAPCLELTNNGLAPYAGGIPLKNSEGVLQGAVGVSGGSIAQDFEIAKAAAAAFNH
ncbi:MAG TPA: heme-binding protein [Pyrinomonadaceae bacterium]|nr:heme-binding protein [Pyrinomonadaceae bacterium]